MAPVPKYDAFGREIGEDTLAGLGGSSAEREDDLIRERVQAQAQATPVAEPPRQPDPPVFEAPVADPAVPQRPVFVPASGGRKTIRVGRRTGLGCLGFFVGVPILLMILGIGAALLVGLSAESTVEKRLVDIPRPSESLKIAKPAKPPRGLEPRSLVRRKNFAGALRKLRAASLGSPSTLRVAPERINAALVTKAGRLNNVMLTFDGKLQRLSSTAGFKSVTTDTFAQVNTAAPERLTREGARRLGRKTTSIDYTAHTAGGGQFAWGAYFKGGGIAQGDVRGTFVSKLD